MIRPVVLTSLDRYADDLQIAKGTALDQFL
jgi:hypothetical protein